MATIVRIASAVLALTLAGSAVAQGVDDIYVDAAGTAGGDGKTPGTAYPTIAKAVTDANVRTSPPTIHVAPGTYVEALDTTITRRMRILGTSVLALDGWGLPTGAVADAAVVRPAVAAIPKGNAILKVHASGVEISGLVFEGIGGQGQGFLLRVDGASEPDRALDGISIRRNVFREGFTGLHLRLASATIAGNFFGKNGAGMQCCGGYERGTAHPAPEPHVLFQGNRAAGNRNLGITFAGHVASRLVPALAHGPGVLHVEIVGNEFARNGANLDYPERMQNTGLLFNLNHFEESDALQRVRVDASIHRNRFVDNVWYGLGVSQRVGKDSSQAPCTFDGRLASNVYCGNGLNAALFDFSLTTQTHEAVDGFRYGSRSTYTIDARADPLSCITYDYDHPVLDPYVEPVNTVATNNRLVVDGRTISPGGPRTRVTRPPRNGAIWGLVRVDAPPTLVLVGADPLVVRRHRAFVDPGARASDPCEGDLTARITASGTVDTGVPGSYTRTYVVTDAGGQAADVSRTVNVVE